LQVAVASALEQTYGNVEVIVVDDCSPKHAASDALTKYASAPNLKVIRHEQNLGLGGSRNTGARASTGEFIAPLDGDDYLAPNFVEKLLAQCQPGISGACSSVQNFGDLDVVAGLPPQLHLAMCSMAIPSTFIYRREMFDALGGYLQVPKPSDTPAPDSPLARLNESQRACIRVYPDAEYWVRLLSAGHKIAYLDEPLYFYRKFEGSLSATRMLDQLPTLAALHPDLYNEHIGKILRLQEEKYWQAKAEMKVMEDGFKQMQKYYTELKRDYESLASVHHELTVSRSWTLASKLMQTSALLKRIAQPAAATDPVQH
jgi:glycosyltransferase involved in cell wall biosynthesis